MKNQNKKILLFVIATIVTSFGIGYTLLKGTSASDVEMPANPAFDDINFYKCVVDAYNTYHGTNISYTTSLTDSQLGSSKLYDIYCGGGNKSDEEKVVSIKGVEKLTSLIFLHLNQNKLTDVDVSKNTKLRVLDVSSNLLTSIDVSKNVALTRLYVSSNQITELDVSKNTELTDLSACRNHLTSIDVSKNTKLINLSLGIYNHTGDNKNQLTELDVSKNTLLENLDVSSNLLTSLDVSKNTMLSVLRVNDNQLTNINVNKNTLLTKLYVGGNKITSIDVSKNTVLTNLSVGLNQLTEIDVSQNVSLKSLDIRNNKISNLNLSNNTSLTNVSFVNNNIEETYNLYKGSTCTLKEKIVFPSQWIDQTSIWSSNSSSIATVDASSGLVTAMSAGTARISRTHTTSYLKYSHLIKVYKIKSNKYVINEDNGYVLVYDNNVDTIKDNISVTEGATIDVDLTNKKLYVKVDDTVIKEFKLIIATSSVYDLSSDYIYLGSNKFSSSNVSITGDGTITTSDDKMVIKVGNVVLKEITLVSISSNKYNLSNSYIYLGTGSFSNSDISCVNCSVSNYNDVVTIRGNQKTYQKFDLLKISSNTYDLSKGYIYVGVNQINTDNISVSNGMTKLVENNKLLIKYGDVLLTEFDIINISSEKYDLSKDYIYVGANKINTSDISISNGMTKSVENNKLLIKYGDVLLTEFDIINISSEKYDLTKDYIYVGTNKINTSDISESNGVIKSVQNNQLLIKYDSTLLDKYDIVAISSEKYDLSKDYIYVGFKDFDVDNFNCTNCIITETNNVMSIRYNSIDIKQYPIVKITTDKYSVVDNKISVKGVNVEIANFIANFNSSSKNIGYKVYENSQVTSGYITGSMVLKIYYNDTLIDEYRIFNDYVDFDNVFHVSNNVLGNVSLGMTLGDLFSKISTNGEINVYNKNDVLINDDTAKLKTGDKFKVNFDSDVLIYKVSVNGDVNGDGIINNDDIVLSSKHVVKRNVLVGDEYIRASDFDNNNNIDINDIIKMVKKVKVSD